MTGKKIYSSHNGKDIAALILSNEKNTDICHNFLSFHSSNNNSNFSRLQ